jgi:hypothetical protein
LRENAGDREVRMQTATTPRRRVGPIGLALIVAGLLAFSLFGIQVLDALIFNPWALSLTGAPTLTGEWTGEIGGDGGSRTVHLVLRHAVQRRCTGDCSIAGTLRLCRGTALEREYSVDGDTAMRSGRSFHVNLHADSDFRAGEFRLGRLEGEWNGGDAIRLEGPWWAHSNTAVATVRRGERVEEQPRVSFELNRGDRSAC